MKKVLTLVLTLVLVVGCLASCGEKEPVKKNTDPYLNVMLGTNVMSLDTHEATDGESFEVIADCIDGLMQMDAEGSAIPAIAASYVVSEDGKTYTFTLRDAKWSNGKAVTAADFVFAWRRIADLKGEYAYMLSDIAQIVGASEIIDGTKGEDGNVTYAAKETLGVTAVDEKTLKVDLLAPCPYFTSLMYFPTFYPINEEFYNSCAAGTYGTSPATFLSNGAFVLEDYQPGTASFKLKKNADYWDAANVKVEGIKYQVVTESGTALSSFKAGNLDIVTINGEQVGTVKKDDALKSNLKVTGAGYMWYLSFSQNHSKDEGHAVENYTASAFNNVNLRLAFTMALDRESIADNFVKDGSLATYTAVPPQFAAYSGEGADAGKDFSADQAKFADYCDFDVTKAQEYLAKAKTELGKENFTFELVYGNNEGDEVSKVAQAIKDQIETNLPGVTITLKSVTKAERLNCMQEDAYEVALTRWGPDYADPMTYMEMWVTNCSNNYGFWSNAEYDAAIKACKDGSLDYAARWAKLYEAEELVMKDAVIAPLYTKSNANMISSSVTGVEFHPVALNRVFKNAVKTVD